MSGVGMRMTHRNAVLLLLVAGGCLLAVGVIGPQDLLDAATSFLRGLQAGLQLFVDTLGTGAHFWATLGVAFIIAAVLLLLLGNGKKSTRKG